MKPSKFIKPGERLTVAELYKRQFGCSTSLMGYEVYLRSCLLRDHLIYIDFQSLPYVIYRKETYLEKLLDKLSNWWYNNIIERWVR